LLRCVFVYSFVSTTWSLRNALKLTALRSRVPALGSLVSQSWALVHHPLLYEYTFASVKTGLERDMNVIVGSIEQASWHPTASRPDLQSWPYDLIVASFLIGEIDLISLGVRGVLILM
jgi:hypothetical protein